MQSCSEGELEYARAAREDQSGGLIKESRQLWARLLNVA